jgi:hypothetical protein
MFSDIACWFVPAPVAGMMPSGGFCACEPSGGSVSFVRVFLKTESFCASDTRYGRRNTFKSTLLIVVYPAEDEPHCARRVARMYRRMSGAIIIPLSIP